MTNQDKNQNLNTILLYAKSFAVHFQIQDFIETKLGPWMISHHSDHEDAIKAANENRKNISYAIIEVTRQTSLRFEKINELTDALNKAPVLIISKEVNVTYFEKMLSLEINGIIDPDDNVISVSKALESIDGGGFPISPSFMKILIPSIKQKAIRENYEINLTPQQRRILALIYVGKSYTQIASDMNLSINTIHTYSRSLFKRLNAHSKTEAIHFAKNAGLLS